MKLITTKITLMNGKKVRLGGPPSFERRQMLSLGIFGLDSIKARVARGVGSDDAQMKQLRPSYAKFKNKLGHGTARNLSFTGDMLNAFSVRYADAQKVTMAITTLHGREAGNGNERRTPWFGFSSLDTLGIVREARNLFRVTVEDWKTRTFRGGRGST